MEYTGLAKPPDGALVHPSREHHLDAVRAVLMLLGIPFHATHPFRDDGQTWMVMSADRSLALTHVMEFLHLFRMQGFFLIAGYFTAMLLLKRSVGAYLESRLTRLVPPLVVGLLAIVPLMNLASDLHNASGTRAGLGLWIDQSLTLGRETTGHLWFVIVLIYFSAVAALVCLSPKLRTFRLNLSDRAASRLFLPVMLAIGLGIGVYEVALLKVNPLLPELLKNPVSLGFALEYAPYFAIGALLNRVPAMNRRFNRFSWLVALVAIGLALVAVGAGELPKYTRPVLKAVAAVGLTQSIVSAAGTLFKTESRRVRELVEASFVIYLLHLPIIVATFGLVEAIPAPYFVRYLVMIAIAFTLSFLGWLIVKRSAWLLFLMSGVRTKPRPG